MKLILLLLMSKTTLWSYIPENIFNIQDNSQDLSALLCPEIESIFKDENNGFATIEQEDMEMIELEIPIYIDIEDIIK